MVYDVSSSKVQKKCQFSTRLKAPPASSGRPRWQVMKLEDQMRSIESAGLYSILYFDRVLLRLKLSRLLVTLEAVSHT